MLNLGEAAEPMSQFRRTAITQNQERCSSDSRLIKTGLDLIALRTSTSCCDLGHTVPSVAWLVNIPARVLVSLFSKLKPLL